MLQRYSEENPDQPEFKFTYSPQERRRILSKYHESNQQVAREYLHIESGKLFDEPEFLIDEPWAPYPGLDQTTRYAIASYLNDNGIVVDYHRELKQVNSA